MIGVDEVEKVTDAAFRNKINLPMDCRDVVRGTPKCKCEEGEYALEFYMNEEEADERYVRACQMTVENDCVISVHMSFQFCKTGSEKISRSVRAIDALLGTSYKLTVKRDKPMGFLPRHYVNINAPGTAAHRFCSFSSHLGAEVATFRICNLQGEVMPRGLEAGPNDDDQGPKGFVTDHVTPEELNGGDGDVYLCGPPSMDEAVRQISKTLGTEPENFYFENFTTNDMAEAV